MDQALELTTGAGDVRAINRDLFLVALHLGAAHRAGLRHPYLLRWIIRVASLGNRADDLGNDFPRTLDLDPIARPQVLLADEIEVVEGSQLHHRAADLDRLEDGVRIERPRSPDVHLDG